MTRVSARRLVAKVAREVQKASRHGIRMSWLAHDGRAHLDSVLPALHAKEVVIRTWRVSWDEIDAFFICPTNEYMGRLRLAWKRRVPKTLGHVPPPGNPPTRLDGTRRHGILRAGARA